MPANMLIPSASDDQKVVVANLGPNPSQSTRPIESDDDPIASKYAADWIYTSPLDDLSLDQLTRNIAAFAVCATFDQHMNDQLLILKGKLSVYTNSYEARDSQAQKLTLAAAARFIRSAPSLQQTMDHSTFELSKMRESLLLGLALQDSVQAKSARVLQRWVVHQQITLRTLTGASEIIRAAADESQGHLEAAIGWIALIALYITAASFSITTATGLYGMNTDDLWKWGKENAFVTIMAFAILLLVIFIIMVLFWLWTYYFLLWPSPLRKTIVPTVSFLGYFIAASG